MDKTKITVTVVPQPTGGACLEMYHPGGPVLASVVLTNEIVDYLMHELPRHRAMEIHGMTGPH